MKQILDAILAGDTRPEEFAAFELPESYRAVTVRKDETDMFAGLDSRDKDPRKSLHVDEVALPELGPGEALVAVMASAINYNTVWTSIFEPMSTFGFLERYGRTSPLAKRHYLPYHIVGSDLAGVELATGAGVHASIATRGRPAMSSWRIMAMGIAAVWPGRCSNRPMWSCACIPPPSRSKRTRASR